MLVYPAGGSMNLVPMEGEYTNVRPSLVVPATVPEVLRQVGERLTQLSVGYWVKV
jgi:hypothetical protein